VSGPVSGICTITDANTCTSGLQPALHQRVPAVLPGFGGASNLLPLCHHPVRVAERISFPRILHLPATTHGLDILGLPPRAERYHCQNHQHQARRVPPADEVLRGSPGTPPRFRGCHYPPMPVSLWHHSTEVLDLLQVTNRESRDKIQVIPTSATWQEALSGPDSEHFLTSPLPGQVTIIILLHLARVSGLLVHFSDGGQAFPRGEPEKKPTRSIPPGLVSSTSQALAPEEARHGLQPSPRRWHSRLKGVLGSMGFQPVHGEPHMFLLQRGNLWVLVYVTLTSC